MNPIAKIIIDIIYLGLERLGRYYSTYRAFVVDENDPEGYGRVKLVIPGIADNPMDYWAWGVGQFSGKNYGCHIIPQAGDMVWVEFENGDPNKPTWRFGSFSAKSELTDDLKNPKNFWFKTPSGHYVSINDDSGEILIENNDKQVIRIDSKGINIKSNGKINLDNLNQSAKYSAALAEELIIILGDMIDTMGEIKVLAKGVPSSVPVNLAEIAILKTQLNKIKSLYIKII